MGVQLYRVEPFEHPQENAAFERLCSTAETYLRDLEDVRIIGNLRFSDWQMDVLVLARRSITIIDFKDWSGAITVRRTRPWTNREGKPVLGGSYVNPFAQVAAYRDRLQAALAAGDLAGADFTHVNGLVLFTKDVELIKDPQDAFGPFVDKWFHVTNWTGGIHMLRNAASSKINLSSEILDQMVAELNAVPFEPMPEGRLVPQSAVTRAVTDALIEQEFQRMVDYELEHRDEMQAEAEAAQEAWDRLQGAKK